MSPKQWWRRQSLGKKIKTVLITIVAVVCAMALAMGTLRFVQWRLEVKEAEARQLQLTQEYDFDPGDIIADGQFFNGNAMSEQEVQSFLDEQGAACSGGECLKSKTFDTTDQPANEYCDAYEGAKGETAAAIITKSAKACNISQKVLLTVLQKEQHLVTATTITDFQYKAAMGLSCPDDASCDPEYAGFFKQVYGAAKRYQYYTAHEDRYGYHAGALNYVQYHPNASCGGTNVYIKNKATALLYIYTPYQPNEAALAAGVGTGDSCSSYGNRNFAIIYESWFGSPRS
ncbi:hemagglutinin [Bifidobacterium colobi]|nr:hemagglutinin [Bifidobacterium colobi]